MKETTVLTKNSVNSRYYPVINLKARPEETKILSPEEEQKLAIKIKNAEEKFNNFKKAGVPKTLLNQAENEFIELRNEFMMHNVRLVMKIALALTKKYGCYEMEMENDFFSFGFEGLKRAVEKFDSGFGTKFSTHATLWIEQAIRRRFQNENKIIRTPIHVQEGIRKAKKIARDFEKLHGRAPSQKEMAKNMRISQKKLKELMDKEISILSLNYMIAEDIKYEAIIPNQDISPETVIEMADFAKNSIKNLDKIFQKMEARESFILKERIGYFAEKSKTMTEIGKKLKLSRERIRQIQEITLQKFQQTAEQLIKSGEIKDDPVLEKITETDGDDFKIPPIKILDILQSLNELIQNQIETYNAIIA